MPLKKGSGKKVVSENIKELYEANDERKAEGKKPRSSKQIIAIALTEAKKTKGSKLAETLKKTPKSNGKRKK